MAVPGETSPRRARDTLSDRLKNHAVVVDYPIPDLKVRDTVCTLLAL